MKTPDPDRQQQAETVEHLLGIVIENRDKRCAEVREQAQQQAREIIQQAHAKSRARMHRHVIALREKHRQRVSSATARNQTLLRQQRQKADRAIIDTAWPLLRKAMLALWNDTASRRRWQDLVMSTAANRILQQRVLVEHPTGLSEQELDRMTRYLVDNGIESELQSCEDVKAGLRLSAQGTVIDATLDGLLKQRASVEAMLIAAVKQGGKPGE